MFVKLRRRTTNNPLSVPLAQLLTSNNPPSDMEETHVRSTIQAMRGEITALELETNNYSSHPGSVTTREDCKATSHQEYHSSRIDHIPFAQTSPRASPTDISENILGHRSQWTLGVANPHGNIVLFLPRPSNRVRNWLCKVRSSNYRRVQSTRRSKSLYIS